MVIRILSKSCQVVGWVLIGLVGIDALVLQWGVWREGGFRAIQMLLSPYNLGYYLPLFLRMTPGVLLLLASKKIKDSKQVTGPDPDEEVLAEPKE